MWVILESARVAREGRGRGEGEGRGNGEVRVVFSDACVDCSVNSGTANEFGCRRTGRDAGRVGDETARDRPPSESRLPLPRLVLIVRP